jgi:hypothetical protein
MFGSTQSVPAQFQAPQEGAPRTKRLGLMPLLVGTSFMVRCKDGKRRQFLVKSRRAELARLATEERDVKIPCHCFRCNKDYPDENALIADHPSHADMASSREEHVYAYLSEEPETKADSERFALLKQQLDALMRAKGVAAKSLAKIEDIEEYTKAEARIADVDAKIARMTGERSALLERRIGLLSDAE